MFQETRFLKMVSDSGSPGVKRQLVQPESLKGMEARYEQTLAELGKAVKVKAKLQSCLRPLWQLFQTWIKPVPGLEKCFYCWTRLSVGLRNLNYACSHSRFLQNSEFKNRSVLQIHECDYKLD